MSGAEHGKKPWKIVPSDIFPAVRRFLDSSELPKTRRAFDVETCADEEAAVPAKKNKKVRALEALDITTACQARHRKIAAVDLLPVLRRFLVEGGLVKTLKALGKESPEEEADGAPAGKKAKVLAALELTEACREFLEAERAEGAEAADAPEEEGAKKRKKSEAENAENGEEEKPAKKAKQEAGEAEAEADAEAQQNTNKKNGRNKKGKEDRPPPVPFKRIDDEKCKALIKDSRLLDNTHKAKQKFGASAGDTWADKAAEDLLKTRGKGFRKEMAKKKRASWRGGGSIDMGVNSVKFADSDSE